MRRGQSCSLKWAALVWEGGGDGPVTKNKERGWKKFPGKEFSCYCFPEQWGSQGSMWELWVNGFPCH